jgi:preprotein translocase subunit SecG
MGLPLAAASFIMNIIAVVFVFVAVALIIIVLIQKARGGGLSSAFGGAGSSSVFGSKTGDFLTWATITVAGLFLVLAVIMSKFYRPAEPQLGPAPTSAPAQPMPAPVAPAAPIPARAPISPVAPVRTQAAPAQPIPAKPAVPVNVPAGK